MRQSYSELYVHLVWATWDRVPLLVPELQRFVFADILCECDKVKAQVLALGGTEDHVHLLAQIPTTLSVAMLAKQAKGASSHLVTHGYEAGAPFRWQAGFGGFTVSRWDVPKIQDYIRRQPEHHRGGTTAERLERIFLPEPSQ
ncbi:MAG TPA: IS200/IS605 family transposase [Armatimonadota bacterium]|nr:IS200/IS605 family transposase [Armatimonadota bacterium]